MVGFIKREFRFALLAAVVLFFGTACGKKDFPVPQPLPSAPGGGIGIGGGFYGGGCGVAGSLPLNQTGTPYYGALGNNAIQLSLYFVSNFSFDLPQQNIVGSGMFSFPDLNQILGTGNYSPTTQTCVSSTNMTSGTPTPGTISYQQQQFNPYMPPQQQQGGATISLMLQGIVQVPARSPFGGFYPGGYAPQYTQELVTMMVGYDCPATLSNGRIKGCVNVRLGQQQQQQMPYPYPQQDPNVLRFYSN